MSDYTVQIQDLRDSGAAAAAAAGQLSNLQPGPGLDQAAAALPGSTSAGLITQVSGRWGSWATTMGTDLRAYAGGLQDAASTYERSETEAEAAFGAAVGTRHWGPR